ncbi:hypothetical protein TNCV_2761591 [Trichonephila clavipes]|nr:hypothetical protein TNCV_2761591 [Trichonephila clavipes]
MLCDFHLWRFIKDRVYVPPLPADLSDLRHRTEAAVATITSDTLSKVWVELAIELMRALGRMWLTLNIWKLVGKTVSVTSFDIIFIHCLSGSHLLLSVLALRDEHTTLFFSVCRSGVSRHRFGSHVAPVLGEALFYLPFRCLKWNGVPSTSVFFTLCWLEIVSDSVHGS